MSKKPQAEKNHSHDGQKTDHKKKKHPPNGSHHKKEGSHPGAQKASDDDIMGDLGDVTTDEDLKEDKPKDDKPKKTGIVDMRADGEWSTLLTLGIGSKHGIYEGMSGYLPDPKGGGLAEFTVKTVSETSCTAHVDLDQVQIVADYVILNAKMPVTAPKNDMKTSIVDERSAEDGSIVILSIGRSMGVHVGMKGYVVAPGGQKLSLTITHAHNRSSEAHVDAGLAQLGDARTAVLNPSGASDATKKPKPAGSHTGHPTGHPR